MKKPFFGIRLNVAVLRAFERNRENRKRSRRKRLIASIAAALLFHFFLLLFVGIRAYIPVGEPEEQFLEITEFIPPEQDEPDTPVEDPKKLSDRSYNSRVNKQKFGISGSPPPSPSFPATRRDTDKSDEKLSLNDKFVRELIKNTTKESFRDFYPQSDRQVGNDGDYRGEDAEETDISVEKFKHYSYLIKLKEKIANAWRPADARVAYAGSDIQANVRIVIARNGELKLVRIVTTSGFPRFDREAVRAVKAASPYSPLPQNWENDKLDIVMNFILINFSWRQILIQS